MTTTVRMLVLGVTLAFGTGAAALADARLALATDQGSAPLRAGDRLTVSLSMSNLEREVVGYQAFIGFDERQLRLVSGAYTLEPFGLHLIDPIVANGGAIALAAGIDPEAGQTPTAEDALLATLVFESVTGGCVTGLGFPPHEPPTTLTDDQGQPVLPLILEALPSTPAAGLHLFVEYGSFPVQPGDFVVVRLAMNELCDRPAVGFQAFLRFDASEISFVSGSYTEEPFGLPIIDPIVTVDGIVTLAAGIDTDSGQAPASGPAELAILTFRSVGGGCVTTVAFDDHDPPTRLSDDRGEPIRPLVLTDPPVVDCPADVVPDCEVNFEDILAVLSAWGPCEGCPADINDDGVVDFADLLEVLRAWGPCVE